MSDALEALAQAAGLVWRYNDGAGDWREAPPESLRAVLGALGLGAETDSDAADSLKQIRDRRARRRLPDWTVVRADAAARLELAGEGPAHWRLDLADGDSMEGRADAVLETAPLPTGRHRLTIDGQATTLLAAPERLPEPPRAWGVTLPLYGLRPEAGGGLGSYGDLARAADALGRLGAGFLGVNPVHAGFPEDPTNYSPYAPSSRRHLNTIHIETGAEGPPHDSELIEYPEAVAFRRKALADAYAAFAETGDAAGFEAWRAARGETLARFALHQALSEAHGPYWTGWPEPLRDSRASAVRDFAAAHADRLRFHAWLQWMAETQLSAAQKAGRDAGMRYGLYLDLAVGTHPAGAETWTDPAQFARGVSLGAPPDAFSADGQVWGVAPLSPLALQQSGFAVLAETLREQFRFCGLLRIDHILGFDRAFWCPDGLPGVYVMMPKAAMLAVARIEATLADASIIGEDLGNIPDGLRADLDASGILGCRVAMFERAWQGDRGFVHSSTYDPQTLAAFASHDLPTWRGWRKGLDIEWRGRLGQGNGDIDHQHHQRREDVAAFDRTIRNGEGSVDALHDFLGASASRLVALQAEDILGLEEQANLPGTVFEHPNWRRRLPVRASEFASDDRFARTAEIMRQSGR